MPVVHDNSKEWKAELFNRLERRMFIAVQDLRGDVVRSISTGQTTREGKFIGASIPGQPPHVRTGRLRQSITSRVLRTRQFIIGRVGTNVRYAPFLEYGTVRMAARPYLRPALHRNLKRITAILMGKK